MLFVFIARCDFFTFDQNKICINLFRFCSHGCSSFVGLKGRNSSRTDREEFGSLGTLPKIAAAPYSRIFWLNFQFPNLEKLSWKVWIAPYNRKDKLMSIIALRRFIIRWPTKMSWNWGWWTKNWPPVHGLPIWTTLKWTSPLKFSD